MKSPNVRLQLNLPERLVTRRLCLRDISCKNVDAFLDFMNRNDQDYPRSYLGWEKEEYSRENAKNLIKVFRDQTIRNYHLFRIGDPNTIIGEIMVTSDRLRSPRVAYYISPEYRRKGYASEGYDAVMTSLLSQNRLSFVWEETDNWNRASRHFLMSKGFRCMGKRQSSNFNLEEESIVFLRKTAKPSLPR